MFGSMCVSSHHRSTGQIPQQPGGRGGRHHRPEHQRDKTGAGLEAAHDIHSSLHHQNPGESAGQQLLTLSDDQAEGEQQVENKVE